jgi:hypothetical protein
MPKKTKKKRGKNLLTRWRLKIPKGKKPKKKK